MGSEHLARNALRTEDLGHGAKTIRLVVVNGRDETLIRKLKVVFLVIAQKPLDHPDLERVLDAERHANRVVGGCRHD